MKKSKKVLIIGSGITGITCAYVLNLLDPKLSIEVIDAGPEPQLALKDTFLKGHVGATLGHGRDARHFSGTEGLSFQNPVHTKLLYEGANSKSSGWCTIPEKDLTLRERNWREECVERYKKHVSPKYNPYNEMHAALNYGGMESWSFLTSIDKGIIPFRISSDTIYVAFENEKAIQADFASETHLNPFNSNTKSKISFANSNVLHDEIEQVFALDRIYPKLLRVPGSSWKIQSLWNYLYKALQKKSNVAFNWNSPIAKTKSLPDASVYVWAAGSTDTVPDIYREHSRVQGIGGWWLSMPNFGFKVPFKISAPQPNGYLNFTPVDGLLHISGGFGWVGERGFQESRELLKSTKDHFLEQLSLFLKMSKSALKEYGTGCCIRPSTPTGLPDVKMVSYGGHENIMISGACKAGATQAPLLALHVASSMELDFKSKLKSYRENSAESAKVIDRGLDLLAKGLEPK